MPGAPESSNLVSQESDQLQHLDDASLMGLWRTSCPECPECPSEVQGPGAMKDPGRCWEVLSAFGSTPEVRHKLSST